MENAATSPSSVTACRSSFRSAATTKFLISRLLSRHRRWIERCRPECENCSLQTMPCDMHWRRRQARATRSRALFHELCYRADIGTELTPPPVSRQGQEAPLAITGCCWATGGVPPENEQGAATSSLSSGGEQEQKGGHHGREHQHREANLLRCPQAAAIGRRRLRRKPARCTARRSVGVSCPQAATAVDRGNQWSDASCWGGRRRHPCKRAQRSRSPDVVPAATHPQVTPVEQVLEQHSTQLVCAFAPVGTHAQYFPNP